MTLDPAAAFILGHRIEARGRTWSTWTIELDDAPALLAQPWPYGPPEAHERC